MFGPRVIGVQIGRSGDGYDPPTSAGQIWGNTLYNVGRTFLLDLLLAQFRNHDIRLSKSPDSQRAYQQLMALEPEQRESGIIYKCPPAA